MKRKFVGGRVGKPDWSNTPGRKNCRNISANLAPLYFSSVKMNEHLLFRENEKLKTPTMS